MLDSGWTACVPEWICSDIACSKDIFLAGLKENISLESSFFSLEIFCKLKDWFNPSCNDEHISWDIFFISYHTFNLAFSFDSCHFGPCDNVNSILF